MTLTNEQLKNASEHLSYEIDMLLKKDVSIDSSNISTEEKIFLQNILLESFVVHLRNLITFLYPTPNTKPNDVYARDFFPDQGDEMWEKICPPLSLSLNLKNARIRAHKEVGHLTTERISGTPKHKEWDVVNLREEIKIILRIFCEKADKSKLDSSVSSHII